MVALVNTQQSNATFTASQAWSPSVSTSKRGAERRAFPRKEISAQIQGKRIDHSLPALRQPHLALSLRDLSVSGLSALSPMPLENGERLLVSLPAQGVSGSTALRGAWNAVGRVIRCETSSLGYRVAVEFDTIPAAA